MAQGCRLPRMGLQSSSPAWWLRRRPSLVARRSAERRRRSDSAPWESSRPASASAVLASSMTLSCWLMSSTRKALHETSAAQTWLSSSVSWSLKVALPSHTLISAPVDVTKITLVFEYQRVEDTRWPLRALAPSCRSGMVTVSCSTEKSFAVSSTWVLAK